MARVCGKLLEVFWFPLKITIFSPRSNGSHNAEDILGKRASKARAYCRYIGDPSVAYI